MVMVLLVLVGAIPHSTMLRVACTYKIVMTLVCLYVIGHMVFIHAKIYNLN
jgi:hypothetical protein